METEKWETDKRNKEGVQKQGERDKRWERDSETDER